MRIDFYNTSFSSAYNYTENNSISSSLIDGKLVHVGVGPKNIETLDATVASYLGQPETYPYYSIRLTYDGGNSGTYSSVIISNNCISPSRSISPL